MAIDPLLLFCPFFDPITDKGIDTLLLKYVDSRPSTLWMVPICPSWALWWSTSYPYQTTGLIYRSFKIRCFCFSISLIKPIDVLLSASFSIFSARICSLCSINCLSTIRNSYSHSFHLETFRCRQGLFILAIFLILILKIIAWIMFVSVNQLLK